MKMDNLKNSPESKVSKSSSSSSELSQDDVSQHETHNLTRCTRFRLSQEYELSICNCKHILRMTVGERHSVVNPQHWLCNVCYTTESVWACLSCPNVACGRYIHEHALNHYIETQHPLSIDVNELYVYCYACEEYVLNDNKAGDIKVLRETLQAIRYQNFTGTTRSGHTLRTATISADEDIQMRRRMQQQQLDRDDRNFTAIWHSRFVRQRKAFHHWLHYVRHKNDHLSGEEAHSCSASSTNNSPECNRVRHESIRLREFAISDVKSEEECEFSSATANKDLLPSFNDVEKLMDLNSSAENTAFGIDNVDLHAPVQTSPHNHANNSILTSVEKFELIERVHNSKLIKLNSVDETVTENLESTSLNDVKSEGDFQNNEESVNTVNEDVKNSTNVPECSSAATNTPVGRPKRANAASRYHEIMYRLASSSHTEPVKKRIRLTSATPLPSAGINDELETRRRSARLIKKSCDKAKAAEKARRRKKVKNKHRKKLKKDAGKTAPQKTQKSQSKKGARSACPAATTSHRRIRTQSGLRSLYDSIPNKAVTSLIPGVTGLRNLGNTCYLNSIIQVLGHLQKFRLCLLAARDLEGKNDPFNDDHPHIVSHHRRVQGRRSTMEIYENQTHVSRRMLRLQSGLNGGHEDSVAREKELVLPSAQLPPALSLCQELNDLYHIMWSGKWKLVSPCHFLSSVWQLIPSFRGYSQQDAQEFLCELLDKIVSELERKKRRPSMLISNGLASRISKVVHAVFEGNLHSKVKCLECCHISSTIEPFWDLSLEFPPRYHVSANNWKNTSQGCSLSEMLEKFTEEEQLDGGQVYNCARCNHFDQDRSSRRHRLPSRKTPQKFTEAVKQIKISKLPQILRFHLKRFRWSGRNHREKITVPVHFPSELDIREHCWLDNQDEVALSGSDGTFMYDLSAVVIHHGRGFGSGHYTAYCWNDIGKFWVHCNDSNLELCSIDDVMAAQAYILFYTQRGLDPQPHLSALSTPDMSPPTSPFDADVFESDIG